MAILQATSKVRDNGQTRRRLLRAYAAAIEQVASNSDAITNPEIFDVYRSVLKHANQVYGQLMTKMLDSICSGLQSDVLTAKGDLEAMGEDAYVEHKTAIEMYAFLLCWFATIAETVKPIEEEAASAPAPKSKRGRGGKSAAASRTAAKKKTSEWSWSAQIDNVLKHIIRVLGPSGIQSQKMWPDAKERDEFIKYVWPSIRSTHVDVPSAPSLDPHGRWQRSRPI